MSDSHPSSRLRPQDRRIAPRAPIVVRVECKTPRIFAQGQGKNISESGMLIALRETFEVSQTVTLRFALPVAPNKTVAISTGAAIVRAERGAFVGVRFVGLRPAFQDAIAAYVERAAPPSAQTVLEILPKK